MTTTQPASLPLVTDRRIGGLKKIGAILNDLNEPIASLSAFDLCSLATLLLLFMYAGTHWYLMVPIRAICLTSLFIPKLRHSARMWYIVLLLLAFVNYVDRFLIDNHKYLMTYWVLAIMFAAHSKDSIKRDHILCVNGRILIGLCFLFAVIAKLISRDYLNDGFFRYTLLTDSRFTKFTSLVGGINLSTLTEIRAVISDLRSSYLIGADIKEAHLIMPLRFTLLVWLMTVWTLVIESSIALVFLWPQRGKLFDLGCRYLLWIFILTTYSVALVPGFAWTLAVMGLAQLPKSQVRFRIVYVLMVAIVLQVYEIPLMDVIRRVISYL